MLTVDIQYFAKNINKTINVFINIKKIKQNLQKQ